MKLFPNVSHCEGTECPKQSPGFSSGGGWIASALRASQ